MNGNERRLIPARAAIVSVSIVLLSVAGFGVWLRFDGGGPLPIDRWWYDLVVAEPGSPAHALAVMLHVVGGALGVAACVAVATAALLALRRWRDAGAVATAAILGLIGSESLKGLIERARPPGALVVEHGFSYPSGHSMGAAMLATTLALLVITAERRSRSAANWATLVAIAWIVLMLWSRAALHVHWLSDTVAGALLGVSAAILARLLWQPRKARRPSDES